MIIGAGYTGQQVYQQAIATGWRTFATSRHPHLHLKTVPSAHRLHFDLAQPHTWTNIPNPAHLIWCFPAVPLNLVTSFLQKRAPQSCRLLVMGSTSAYLSNGHPINEDTPLKLHLSRVQAEEALRETYGAVIIRLAGLYGPNRHVFDWIRKGKIHNTKKWGNLIHVEDAAAICLLALTEAIAGSTYIASDGHPRTWNEICSRAASQWGIAIPPFTQPTNPGKRVSIHKVCTELGYVFRFPDLYQALDNIELRRP